DQVMPGVNGRELTARIRQIPEGRDIPIVFLSGTDDRDVITAARSVGADGFLVKPVSPVKLLAAVRSMIFSRRLARALATEEV
ncbi:MAG: response regulator, partial [Rhodospirillales bacterium]